MFTATKCENAISFIMETTSMKKFSKKEYTEVLDYDNAMSLQDDMINGL